MRDEADRVLELAQGRERVCLGTGALPYEVEPETVLSLAEYVRSADDKEGATRAKQ